jgi:poly(hydroxyalkanoate) depolymerase family esterase
MKTLSTICAAAIAAALAACGASTNSSPTEKADAPAAEGVVEKFQYAATPSNYPYQVYVPPTYRAGTVWPLVVNVHGCGTSADQQMNAAEANPLADVEHFIVMYPDTPYSCWRSFEGDPTAQHRGMGGDADVIAGMTKEVMAKYSIDPERVYLIGMSSGAYQASSMAATYPDLYAAIGLNAGGAYGQNVSCSGQTDDTTPVYAELAIKEMGSLARFVPVFTIAGTLDPLGEQPAPGGCTRMAFKQWMMTNNIIGGAPLDPKAGGKYPPFAQNAQSSETGSQPDGYTWAKEVWSDYSGCEIGERWVVEGMAHFWSGGSADPQWATWTDPRGPSATRLSWEFFRRFTLSGTKLPCVESGPP